MKLAVFAYTRAGCRTAGRVCRALPEAERCCYAPPRLEAPGFAALDAGVYGEAFANMDALIFVGACGVAVRSIAPFVRDKKTDPAVLCLDERASFVIPLLSGHIGGANALAARLAGALGAKAVITTATDVNGKFAVDAWAAQNGCAIEDFALAKRFAAEILEHDLPLCSEFPVCPPLPGGVVAAAEGPFGVYIGCRTESPFGVTLRLIPRKLRVGLGCRRGTEQAAISLSSGVLGFDAAGLPGEPAGAGRHLRRLVDRPQAGRAGAARRLPRKRLAGPVLFRGAAARRTGQLYGLALRRLRHGRG